MGRMLQWGWQNRADLDVTWQTRRSPPAAPGWITCDPLAEPWALQQAIAGKDAVVVLAGVVPRRSGPMSDNTRLALAALDAATDSGAHLFLCSSAAVYGRASTPCHEEKTPHPETLYGQSKLKMEQAAYAKGGAFTCLRIGNVAGADALLGPMNAGPVPVTLDRFADGRSPRRSYFGPASFAHALADLILCLGTRTLPRIVNFAPPDAVEMADFLVRARIPWAWRPAPDTAVPQLELDTSRLMGLIPLAPETGTAERLLAEWRSYVTTGSASA
ncbi:NAD-dependent epimerase/dehydratase family protein [Rhodophyticola sp. CCM32]|nr:NAD-dependent epimerase/dehydratase family protein [Rhodophyticola sp. CCM32]